MEEASIKYHKNFGNHLLQKTVDRLKRTSDPRKRYEYVLWMAQKLPTMEKHLETENHKVQGCISQVYVFGELIEGKLYWKGSSDALITKGLLALLIQGLSGLTPEEVIAVDPSFIKETGLQSSLTPSRANGFLNILLNMQSQAKKLTVVVNATTS